MAEFNDWLRRLRIEKGLTQQQFADKLNISNQAYSVYENSDQEPKLSRIKEMANILNVTVNDLVSVSNDNKVVDKNLVLFADFLRTHDFVVRFDELAVSVSAPTGVSKVFSYSTFKDMSDHCRQGALDYFLMRYSEPMSS